MDLPPVKDSSMCSHDSKGLDRPYAISNGNRTRYHSETPYEPLVGTYRVNKMFPIAANMAAATFVILLCFVYKITPIENWEYIADGERTVAGISFIIALMTLIMALASFVFWRHDVGKLSGIAYAGIVVIAISMVTNAILAFAPTIVMVDPIIHSRVFLVRWCEWIPCAGLMTFLCDAVDVPRSKQAMRKAVLYSLCQTVSCVFGLVFPFCPGIVSWCCAMTLAVVTWMPIFPRLHYKYQIFKATPRGSSFAEMERYQRHRYSFELMLLCAIIWSFLVVAYAANASAHLLLPVGHPFRPYSLAMYVDASFDVMAKSLYMRHIMDTHKAIFQSEGLAQRQLAELRRLMSALWGSSSDLIVLSIKHELKCLALFSPGFNTLLTGQQDRTNQAGKHKALVLEYERSNGIQSFEDFLQQDIKAGNDLGIIRQAYLIDSMDLDFGTIQEASIDEQVDPASFQVEIAEKLIHEAWGFLNDPPKDSALLPSDFVREDGSKCNCEMKVLPHAENGMIAVVRDVSERFRRFEAERKAEAEALKRQKESQSQTRFVRHEVKNGLLVGIELIDNLRNALDEIQKAKALESTTDLALATPNGSNENLSNCWRRLGELDNNLHEVLDTVLAEAMARDVINEVYHPRMECIDVVTLLRGACQHAERFPISTKQHDMPFVRLDPQLLRYIHRNAVSNACKYGKHGSSVATLVAFHRETNEFELKVLNSPGEGHDKLKTLGDAASDAVFEQGSRLHQDFRIKDRFISSGDGAWIAQKCAKAMGGKCSIRFEDDMTVFSFRCPTEAVIPEEKAETTNFEVPPETFAIVVDDSNIQRKLMSRILGLVGVQEDHKVVIGEKPSDVLELEKVIMDILTSEPSSKILCIVDENLDYGEKGEEVVILSGSRIMKDILTALPPELERRVCALVRSANDSTSELATYLDRTHGFFPKAPMNRDRVREILAPLWAERFQNSQ